MIQHRAECTQGFLWVFEQNAVFCADAVVHIDAVLHRNLFVPTQFSRRFFSSQGIKFRNVEIYLGQINIEVAVGEVLCNIGIDSQRIPTAETVAERDGGRTDASGVIVIILSDGMLPNARSLKIHVGGKVDGRVCFSVLMMRPYKLEIV